MSHTYDPTSPRSLERERHEKADAEARKRAQRAERIKWLMSSPRGRQVMWDILEQTPPVAATFNTNAMQMAYNEGRRSVGVDLLAYVQTTCPDRYFEMLKEHQKNERRNDRIDAN